MEAVLPLNTLDRGTFLKCANELGFDKMAAEKFLFIIQKSDLDVYPLMCEERINILLYVWELCDSYMHIQKMKNASILKSIIKMIVPYTLNLWFSEEWKCSRMLFRLALLTCLSRVKDLLKMYYSTIQWDYWLNLGINPYNVKYLQNLNHVMDRIKRNKISSNTLETIEEGATEDDINYIELEQLPLILLRLIKLFDIKSMEVVKALSMRVLAAWNELYERQHKQSRSITVEDKRCLILICHMHLMAVYELDDVRGYFIDNMMHNIRFYYEGLKGNSDSKSSSIPTKDLTYTPALYIALTCVRIGLKKRGFFEAFIWQSYDSHMVTLFDVVSQAYRSYLIGNLLMELNLLNEEDFAANLPLYQNLMRRYIMVRENSEKFMMNEMRKKEAQLYAHNKIQTIKFITDFKSKFCKGNRLSNIGNCENADNQQDDNNDEIKNSNLASQGNNGKFDPVFQYIPDSENILYVVYKLLAERTYKGWHFAKVILLLKIIRHELNNIDTWRYHPGLTVDFMLNLETKLSRRYEDLAKIFEEHPFLEQEFWLTAFYLNPTNRLYEHVVRCGTRFNRRIREEQPRPALITTNSNYTNVNSNVNIGPSGGSGSNTKFGLLSSTIEVKHIVDLSNFESLDMDYEPLFKCLQSLHLSDNMVKDILTVVFLPRIKTLAWVVNWPELRKRCKILLKDNKDKRRFVELNMAEANERLKFLKIDYNKYRNRPQLDYGTIEEGYENNVYPSEYGNDSDILEDDEEGEDFEDDEDNYETSGRDSLQKQRNNLKDEILNDTYSFLGKRRTRARTAAAFAEAMHNFEKSLRADNLSGDDNQPLSPVIKGVEESANEKCESDTSHLVKKNIKDVLPECPIILSTPEGFKPVVDIWKIDNKILKVVDDTSVYLSESENIFQNFNCLSSLKLLIKPEETVLEDNDMNNDEMLLNTNGNNNVDCLNEKENQYKNSLFQSLNERNTDYIGNTKLNANRTAISQNHSADVEHSLREQVQNVDRAALTELAKLSQSIVMNSESDDSTDAVKSFNCHNADDNNSKNRTDTFNGKDLLSLKERDIKDLKAACLNVKVTVCLQKLMVQDARHLSQPRVLLKRLSVDSIIQLAATESISKRRKVTHFVCFESDPDDDDYYFYGSNYCKPVQKRKTARKRKRFGSESSDYTKSRSHKSRKQRSARNKKGAKTKKSTSKNRSLNTTIIVTATADVNDTTQNQHSNLVVTPRSASGLKLRISHMEQQQKPNNNQDSTDEQTDKSDASYNVHVAQVTSTSSTEGHNANDKDIVVPRALMPVSELIGICRDPLYEEEIII